MHCISLEPRPSSHSQKRTVKWTLYVYLCFLIGSLLHSPVIVGVIRVGAVDSFAVGLADHSHCHPLRSLEGRGGEGRGGEGRKGERGRGGHHFLL